ncbi:MAG: cellulase family glycosylhydrolase [Candidatus Binatia bacterium]|nr:cellulase family glycosylhydrolase [Candidatus Binatia bacterium]
MPIRATISLAVLAALVALVGCTERGPFAAPTLEPLETRVGSEWIRDRRGRVVILRGATYTVTEDGLESSLMGGAVDLTLAGMERLGMNLIRLPLSWALIEPKPGQRTTEYLWMRVNPIVRMAAARGLAVVFSMRPWPRGACDGSDPTIPNWVCDSIPSEDDPSCAFWRSRGPDKIPLRTHYAATWEVVARHYAQDARILGFDVLEEPSAGNCFPAATFESQHLRPYAEELQKKIASAGALGALLYEPPVHIEARIEGQAPFETPAIYSPHIWTERLGPPHSGDGNPLSHSYDRATEAADRARAPLFVGAFGSDLPPTSAGGFPVTSPAMVLLSLDLLDQHLAGGAFYALRPRGADSPAADLGPVEALLSRPYARRIAGIPTSMSFNARTLEFSLRFEDDPEHSPPDPTEIFLSSALYDEGFVVGLGPDDTWTYDEPTQRLLVYRGSSATHEVRVHPSAD